MELHVDGAAMDASLISSDDFVISKESSNSSFAGIIASDSVRRMVFKGCRARGNLAAPMPVASGDQTFSLLGAAYDGTLTRPTAGISFVVDGAVSSGTAPQRMIFETGAGASRMERARINSTGEMGIGKIASAGVLLDVNGPVCVGSYAVAALPSPAQAGQMIHVSNESGGAVIAFSDGSNWRRVTDRAVVS